MVTSSLTGASAHASSNLRALLGRAVGRVRADCKVAPNAMLRFHRTAHELTRSPLDDTRLNRVITAYAEWAGVVGGRWRVASLQNELTLCRGYDRRIRASYAVHSSPALYGKDMWVDWTLRNDTTRRVMVDQGGALWARGVHPSYRGEWDPALRAWLYTWGASSADPLSIVRPGRQVTLRANVALGYLPMRLDGSIIRVRPDLWVSPPRGQGLYQYCAVPVHPER